MFTFHGGPSHPFSKAGAGSEEWRALQAIADRLAPELRSRFRAAVERMRDTTDILSLIRAVDSGAIERVQALLDDRSWIPALAPTIDTIQAAFVQAGAVAADRLSRAGVTMEFDAVNPEAVRWANMNAARLVTAVRREQREAIAEIVERAHRDKITVDDTATQLRSIIGLNNVQARTYTNLINGLREQGLSREVIARRALEFRERALRYRARMIARQELLLAANGGQLRLWDQAIEGGLLTETQERKWIVTPDDRLCSICRVMHDQRAKVGEPFETPNGPVMIPQEIHVQCRCAQGLVFD